MSTARYLVGDVFDRLADIPDGSVDLVLTSPPFLALRSYLPDDHPDKAKEIGSEPIPAEFLDTMLALTAEWGRVLAPHGSMAIEIGDTYAGSGGAGGDYDADGIRSGQPRATGSASRSGWHRLGARAEQGDQPPNYRKTGTVSDSGTLKGGAGWPLDKSLCGIPTLYAWCLAYGRNLLTGEPSPAGMWRVRNIKPWIRSNPPVGALGDKERPATSYITVATRARDRYFDLDAVRTASPHQDDPRHLRPDRKLNGRDGDREGLRNSAPNPGGAPPRDWWHHVDEVLNAVLDDMAGQTAGWSSGATRTGKNDATARGGNWSTYTPDDSHEARHSTIGARGVHLRRALERAGILATVDALDVSPKGYAGAHYAVWPPELVKLLVAEMCPYKVCTTCGQPSRRITETSYEAHGDPAKQNAEHKAQADYPGQQRQQNAQGMTHGRATKHVTTTGWSDCGHGSTWRPGMVLDPFAGSGTTLAVCTGMARDAIGIDIDSRNAYLALERVGMFLEIDDPQGVT